MSSESDGAPKSEKPASDAPKADGAEAKQDGSGNGGGKVRSETAYPYYGLSKSIELVQAVRRAGGNDASSASVMSELGVSKVTDRLWAYGIPAATQFGLVERIGRGNEGRIKITDLALRIVLPGPGDEARLAKIAAFKKPELYAKLLEKFAGHPIPPKENLKNILYREFGIVESMAPNAADAFLESLRAAELVTANGVIMTGDGASTDTGGAAAKHAPAEAVGTQGSAKTIQVPADFVIYKCKIGGGRVIDIPLPPKFTRADVKRLHAFLETQVDDDSMEVPGPTNG